MILALQMDLCPRHHEKLHSSLSVALGKYELRVVFACAMALASKGNFDANAAVIVILGVDKYMAGRNYGEEDGRKDVRKI